MSGDATRPGADRGDVMTAQDPAPITTAVRLHAERGLRQATAALEGRVSARHREPAASLAVAAYITDAQTGDLIDDLDDALRYCLMRAAGDPHKLAETLNRVGLAIVPKAR